jgi:hypothetical protein
MLLPIKKTSRTGRVPGYKELRAQPKQIERLSRMKKSSALTRVFLMALVVITLAAAATVTPMLVAPALAQSGDVSRRTVAVTYLRDPVKVSLRYSDRRSRTGLQLWRRLYDIRFVGDHARRPDR